jgi:hypothetical protein
MVCLSLVMGLCTAIPLGRRPLLDPSSPALLSRAQEGDQRTDSAANPKAGEGTVYSGTSDHAKGATADSPPIPTIPLAEKPIFEKDRRQLVLDLIHYPWQDLGYSIVFMGSRLGYRAMTLTLPHRIEIYVRPGEDPMHQAFDLAHELGHAFDLKYNDEGRRRKWLELRGIKPSVPWFGCDACPDYSTPVGDFAETFAYLLLGPGNYHSQMAPAPRPDQIAELASFCKIEHISEALIVPPSQKRNLAAVRSAKAEGNAKPEESQESLDKTAPAEESHELTNATAPTKEDAPAIENPEGLQDESPTLAPETPGASETQGTVEEPQKQGPELQDGPAN